MDDGIQGFCEILVETSLTKGGIKSCETVCERNGKSRLWSIDFQKRC